MMFGYELENRQDGSLRDLIRNLNKIDIDISIEREKAKDIAKLANQKMVEYNEAYYNKKHKIPLTYKKANLVLIRNLQSKENENSKVKPKYKGPYKTAEVLNHNRYIVTDIPGCQ